MALYNIMFIININIIIIMVNRPTHDGQRDQNVSVAESDVRGTTRVLLRCRSSRRREDHSRRQGGYRQLGTPGQTRDVSVV